MIRPALPLGLAILAAGWTVAALPLGMTGHMTGHMLVVAVAAPLLAYGLSGSRHDSSRWGGVWAAPLLLSLLELAVVWGWHLPAARRAADESVAILIVEQASFLASGLLLWSAVLRAPANGVAALLLTTMHMTLLGALIGLAPRPLYAGHHHAGALDPLADQQLGGAVMLAIGGGSYLAGALAMLGRLLRVRPA